jgi:hypothetical protein
MVFAYTWADLNMANYPPTNATGLALACAAIEAGMASGAAWPALSAFFSGFAGFSARAERHSLSGLSGPTHLRSEASTPAACFNMSAQLPSGANATISSGDWTGVG